MASTSDLVGLGVPGAQARYLGHTTYAGDPTNNVTPEFVGQDCLDTTNSKWYKAASTASSSWKALN